MTTEISVIITYTRAEHPSAAEAISNLLSHERPVQVICVIDPPDGEQGVALSSLRSHRNFSLLRHDIPAGRSAARNTGLILAQSPYLVFVEPDYIPSSDVLDQLITHAIDNNADAVVPKSLIALWAGAAAADLDAGVLDLGGTAGNEVLMAALLTLPAAGILWKRSLFAQKAFPILIYDWFHDLPVITPVICSLTTLCITDVAFVQPAKSCWDYDIDQRENLLVELFKSFGLATDQLKADQRLEVHFEALARAVENLMLALCHNISESDLSEIHKINFLENALILKIGNFQYRDTLKKMENNDLMDLLGSARRFAPKHGLLW